MMGKGCWHLGWHMQSVTPGLYPPGYMCPSPHGPSVPSPAFLCH